MIHEYSGMQQACSYRRDAGLRNKLCRSWYGYVCCSTEKIYLKTAKIYYMSQLQLNKHWRIAVQDTELLVYGGEDAIFTIDLAGSRESFFDHLTGGMKFEADDLSSGDKIVLEQLLSAQIITPVLEVSKQSPRVKIICRQENIEKLCTDSGIPITASDKYDLLILIRTSETFSDFLRENHYAQLTKPHLLLDLAFNHIISIAPLVFPGVTACVACLEGRLAKRWGDTQPPPRPRATNELANLAIEWLATELKKIFDDEDYSLVNKTVVFDVQNRTMTTNKLLTVPLCPYCKKSQLLSSGMLEYTFTKP